MKYLLGLLLVLFASYADIFLFRVNVVPLEPSMFLIPLFIVIGFLKYSITDMYDILKSHTFRFFAFITLLTILYSVFTKASEEVIITEISLNFITLLLYIIAVHFFRTESKPLVTTVIIVGLLLCGGSVVYDLMFGLPNQSLKLAQSVRKGGFGENPNQAASGIKFLALCALVLIWNKKYARFFVLTFLLITVFVTFSRSGLVSVFFILALGAINNWSNQFQKNPVAMILSFFKLIVLFIFIAISLVVLANVIRANFPQFTRGEAGKRLDLLTGQSEASNISSDAIEGGRGTLLLEYFDEFKQNPLGLGTGYSSDKKANGGKLNTHNYYLYLAVNLGFLALLLYIIFNAYNIRLAFKHNQFYYLIFTLLFFLEGFFTHSIFHERSILVCLAFFDSQIYKTQIKLINPINLVPNQTNA
ncbi:O-antigen ligase family protein [uncultured Winogradskyella sp.]|uniref:O-antigen ligase family protein n=1 Tax=uncultured Winogradskyella sp. TaxID=395353 RepID=UPI0030ED76B4|tara:strand:+ start:260 stop:1510 length:1251 start_codon:yes stop_codon:yes gene_type:complete